MGNLRTETRGGVAVERRYNGYNRQVKLIRPGAQSFAQPNGTTLTLPAGTWDYGYNALGQRVSKAQAGGSTTRFLFSPGSLLLGETNAGSSSLDTIYVWLEGKPVGVIRSGQLYAVHTDHLGRPEVATNAAKTVVWRANNLAFDRNVTTDTFGGLSLGFPGQQYDAEAASWYNVFRDFDSSTGRYTRVDPIGQRGGLNPYAYAASNPLTSIDPYGLSKCDVDVARRLIEERVENVAFPESIESENYDKPGVRGRTYPPYPFDNPVPNDFRVTIASYYFADNLDRATLDDLLETLIHEGRHVTQPESEWASGVHNPQHATDAFNDSVPLRDEFRKRREECGCN